MAYIVKEIRKFMEDDGVHSRPLYFCDTNVWLAYLVGSDDLAKQRELPYASFLEGIIHINGVTNPKAIKCYTYQPKILVSSLLISETFNAYMYRIAQQAYLKTIGLTSEDLEQYRKKDYYRKTLDYQEQKELFYAKISAAQNCLIFKDDFFQELDPINLLENLPQSTDFNDFYYFKWVKHLEKKENCSISVVTDDGDFAFEDTEIITVNHKLRELPKRNSIK
jgi:hypothetical protein